MEGDRNRQTQFCNIRQLRWMHKNSTLKRMRNIFYALTNRFTQFFFLLYPIKHFFLYRELVTNVLYCFEFINKIQCIKENLIFSKYFDVPGNFSVILFLKSYLAF